MHALYVGVCLAVALGSLAMAVKPRTTRRVAVRETVAATVAIVGGILALVRSWTEWA